MNKPILQLLSVTKNYGKTLGVSSLSLSINQGEKIALIGQSGSGKSTLLNILSNTLSIDEGIVKLDGKDKNDYLDNRRYAQMVGMIHQSFNLIPQMTVEQNILAGNLHRWSTLTSLRSLILPRNKEKTLELLAHVGLENKINVEIQYLSGGEKQRIAIARTLMQDPKIILADEPVASLDPTRSHQLISLLCNSCTIHHKTLIASLHDIDLAKKYFDRLIGLKNGILFFDLPKDAVTPELIKELYDNEGTLDNEKL